MPIIKSAIKRVKQAEKRRLRNVTTKRSLKAATKQLDAAIVEGDKKKIDESLRSVSSKLDTAVKKNLMHKNRAARQKAAYAKAAKSADTTTKPKATTTTKKTTKAKASTKK